MNVILLLQLLIFGFSLWLGLYLLARDIQKPGLRFAGLGLVTYALGLAVMVLLREVPDFSAESGTLWRLIPLLLPSVFWMAATGHLLGDPPPLLGLRRGASIGVIALLLVALVLIAFSAMFAQLLTMIVPLLFLIVSLVKIWQAFHSTLPRQPIVVLLTATIFFMLGVGLLIIPVEWLSSELVLIAVSFDLILLGFALGYLDAYEEGTRLLPDALRSLAAAGLASVLFGGQVIAVIIIMGNSSLLLLLLFTIIATAITLETFSGVLQFALDRFVFMDNPAIQQERHLLRAVNAALPRTQETIDLMKMNDEQFARLTRRALSHFNDLEKLAASPLTHLPVITLRLQEKGKSPTTLERTHELKTLLAESILKLKPYSDSDFDTTEAWRYYNVLHFPYVMGLKPYSASALSDNLDTTTREVLEWFQTQVPERTLYNWQTVASRLVAQNLKEAHQEFPTRNLPFD